MSTVAGGRLESREVKSSGASLISLKNDIGSVSPLEELFVPTGPAAFRGAGLGANGVFCNLQINHYISI